VLVEASISEMLDGCCDGGCARVASLVPFFIKALIGVWFDFISLNIIIWLTAKYYNNFEQHPPPAPRGGSKMDPPLGERLLICSDGRQRGGTK
jgi:hypothetical protein